MLWIALLAACTTEIDTGDTNEVEEAPAAPTIAWVSPAAEAEVTSTVNASVAVENFLLVDPAKHTEGDASGFIRVTVNDAPFGDFGTTTFTLTSLPVGSNVLVAQLFYDDGDEITISEGKVCEEDDATGTCEPVMAIIVVTVAPG